MEIDLVCCFVDGADPAHQARRLAAWQMALASGRPGLVNHQGHYEQAGELTYAIRSSLTFMPWLRQIIVVTDGQSAPMDRDLLSCGRVRLVTHREFIPADYLPLFSAPIIESFLHRIEGLSDVWLYQNDDFLLGGPVAMEEFVSGSGQLAARTYPAVLRLALRHACTAGLAPRGYHNPYTVGLANAVRLLSAEVGLRPWQMRTPRHFTQVYRKATSQLTERTFVTALERFRRLRFRSFEQLSFSTMVTSMEAVSHGLAAPPPAPRSDRAFFDFADCSTNAERARMWRRVQHSRARFLCLNNIPPSERESLVKAMALRGLGGPPQ